VWGNQWVLLPAESPDKYEDDETPLIFLPSTPLLGNKRAKWLARRASGVRHISLGNPEIPMTTSSNSLSSPLCRLLGRLEVLDIPQLTVNLIGQLSPGCWLITQCQHKIQAGNRNRNILSAAGPSLLLEAACRPLKRLCTEIFVGPGLSQQHFANISQFSRLTTLSVFSNKPPCDNREIYYEVPSVLTALTNLHSFSWRYSPELSNTLSSFVTARSHPSTTTRLRSRLALLLLCDNIYTAARRPSCSAHFLARRQQRFANPLGTGSLFLAWAPACNLS